MSSSPIEGSEPLLQVKAERRDAEALHAVAFHLNAVIDGIPGLVGILSPDGRFEIANRRIVEYCGKTLDELRQWGLIGIVHDDDLARVTETVAAAISAGMPFESEHRVKRYDGACRWFSSRAVPVRDAFDRITHWYVLLTDIDQRRRAEDTLAASERNLRQIINTIPAFVFCNSPEGPNEFLNQRWHDYTGISAEQASGRGWMKSLHPDDLPRLMDEWLKMLHEGHGGEVEGRMRRFDGVYRWFLFRTDALRDESGQVLKWYGTITDIEDRRRAGLELKQAYDRLNEAQRLSKTGSFITDLVADEHDWSDEALRIFDFDPAAKVTVELIRGTVHPDDLADFDSVIARGVSGSDVDFDFRIVTGKGLLKHLHGIAHVIEIVAGRPLFIGALQDVTEMKVADEALNRSRAELAHVSRAASMSALTASIAHEVNQPLAGIVTNAGTCLRMLSSDPPNVEGARETARRTIRDGNRASEVIARLRGMFGKKEFAAETFDLNEAAREVVALCAHEMQRHRIFTRTEFEDDALSVVGDRVQLQQVILNLLMNAADAMKGIDERPRQVVLRIASDGPGSARVSVRDAGTGLAPDSLGKLFDAFYTTKPEGMGIGLSVSRSIVDRHKGRLWAAQNDDFGATFSFTIPRGGAL